MRFNYLSKTALPPLAWLAEVEPEEQQCHVVHGAWVEVRKDAFIEGVWDGPFAHTGFDKTPNVFGSGAVSSEDSVTFVSSTSTTDYLYWQSLAGGKRVLVSNSLPLLLATLDDKLEAGNRAYEEINNSVMAGCSRYIRKIPTCHGHVNRLMHANLLVNAKETSEQDKPLPPTFSSFVDYSAYLHGVYGRLAGNARAAERIRPMQILSTQSKGYDSTACNAIAQAAGIDAVFTVTRGKGIGYYAHEDRHLETDDDGSQICHQLGLRCVPIERRALEADSSMEYLYYACMHKTGDFNLQQINGYVDQPSLLITGNFGEIWASEYWHAKRPGRVNSELVRGDLGNHALTEVRLHYGYVQLALPYIGARRREDIFRITLSQEMDPWRTGNDYDRPIARRIAEEKGIARSAFGQLKMASVLEFVLPILPVNEELRRDYLRFLVSERVLYRWQLPLIPLGRRWNAMVRSASPDRYVAVHFLRRVIAKILRRPFRFPVAFWRLNSAFFCFCVNRRREDYRGYLRGQSGA